MLRALQKIAFGFVIVAICLANAPSARAMIYDENLAYYENQDFVKEYVNGKTQITNKHFEGDETQTKKACKKRYVECHNRLIELGYYVGGGSAVWNQNVQFGISLFAQQSGLGYVPLREIPIVVEALLLSGKAQPAIVPAVSPSEYNEVGEKALLGAANGYKVMFTGKIIAVSDVLDRCYIYEVSVGAATASVLYETPKRAGHFLANDTVRVFGTLWNSDGSISIEGDMMAFAKE